MTEPKPNWAVCSPGRGELTVSPELRTRLRYNATPSLRCITTLLLFLRSLLLPR
jgi:hypothetical protein